MCLAAAWHDVRLPYRAVEAEGGRAVFKVGTNDLTSPVASGGRCVEHWQIIDRAFPRDRRRSLIAVKSS